MNRTMSSHAYREVIAMVAYLHAGTQRWNMADDDSRYLMGDGYANLKSAAIALDHAESDAWVAMEATLDLFV